MERFNLENVKTDNIGMVVLGNNITLTAKVKQLDGFDGVVIYGELRKHFGEYSECVEQYKIIVDAPRNKIANFFGFGLNRKIKKALQLMSNQATEYIQNESQKSIRLASFIPQFRVSII